MPTEMTERQWQAQIVETAKYLGWWVYHTHDSRRSEPGFPDLVLVRPPRLIFAEVKTAAGRLTQAQQDTIVMLDQTCAESYIWRPADWPAILSLLSKDGLPVEPQLPRRTTAKTT